MKRALLASLLLCGCTALNRDIALSPACAGLTLGDSVQADVALITQLIVDIPAENLVGALKAFSDAHGKQQAECIYDIVEAQLGHPVAQPDAGPSSQPSALISAMGKDRPGALELLATFRAARAAAKR